MIQLLDDPHTEISLLDHGYIQFIEGWGQGLSCEPEAGIIEAARMSTGKGFNGWEKDAKLLKYLYEHKHMTPFEMAGMTIEIAAPIFVFREWHRHRTQSYNEMSARYIPLPNEHYSPDVLNIMERLAAARDAGVKNRQAQGVVIHETQIHEAQGWIFELEGCYEHSQKVYENGLNIGIPKELARLPMAVGRYSRMRACGNLRNWLAFLTLRMDPDAQWEIRQYANAVGSIVAKQFPRTWELFHG